ncbi:5-oxoprolinase subunit PxpB [Algimonas porphyrae]|uniref:Allophanate hydrolase n=1 Tax=Algimonas porphyrae TaxID=1128113 RepID=A0ABQ5V3D6_9PROT|nr:5-oxoprolinase subunit PxpB [Algimonas porphyrae]GLQ21497.1 allophanate hydrolase [Algimonas porphyrae]
MNDLHPDIRAYGDHAVLVEWGADGFDADISDRVHALAARLRKKKAFIEVMPGYDSLVASFDGAQMNAASARRRIKDAIVREARSETAVDGRLVEIPVSYGGADGPDLYAMADRIGKSPEAVLALHTGRDYRVCMMGFIPGFAFLSDVDPLLQHPRHATPRAVVPAGSVGIANWQTGIYGLESPGGWQIIGRTDVAMFDADRDRPFYVEAGDRIRFVAQ